MKPRWISAASPGRDSRPFLAWAAVCLLSAAPAGPAAGASSPALRPAQRDSVVLAAADYAEANYVFPDLGTTIARSLRERRAEGAYRDVTDPQVLVDRLTADMQAVTPDRHLKFFYSPEPLPPREEAAEPSAEERAKRRLDAVRQNFGIERAEQLDGNVGYLKLTRFGDPEIAGETMGAAMQFLGNTDALIIDLRQNGGGFGNMVALLTTYFVDGDPVKLADLYDRPSGETSQSWSLPYVPGPRYTGKPLYILTGERTFSAAEGFTYHLQQAGLATVVGERTGGGAHFVRVFQINAHFAVMIPVGNVTDAVSGSNWEGTGVVPDVPASGADAIRTAHRLALQKLLETAEGKRAGYLNMLIGELTEALGGGAR